MTVVREAAEVPVAALEPWDRNPRTITEDRFEDLKRSMEADPEMLRARPLVALQDGRVVMGNMRLRAAQALGWETVPTITVELDEQRARLWALRDNQTYGEWEGETVAELLYELREEGVDLVLTGFAGEEVERILDGVAPARSSSAEPQYECPSCGHTWSGAPRP